MAFETNRPLRVMTRASVLDGISDVLGNRTPLLWSRLRNGGIQGHGKMWGLHRSTLNISNVFFYLMTTVGKRSGYALDGYVIPTARPEAAAAIVISPKGILKLQIRHPVLK
jgi:hypothetical protein